eukprot:s2413_g18.t1
MLLVFAVLRAMQLAEDAMDMATALLAQASSGISWNQLLASRAREDPAEDDAPPGVEKAAMTPKMAASALWEQEYCMDLASKTLAPHDSPAQSALPAEALYQMLIG